MKNKNSLIILSLAVVWLSVFGPSIFARQMDNNILNETYEKEDGFYTRSFTYDLPAEEKLFILASALESRNTPASDLFNLVNPPKESSLLYSYLPVYDNSLYEPEIGRSDVLRRLISELNYFEKNSAIPPIDFSETDLYDMELYSVTDVTNPELSFVLWQITFNKSIPLASVKNVILEAFLDADSGKLYFFSIRTENGADGFEPNDLASCWQDYLGISSFEEAESNAFSYPNENKACYKIDVSGHGQALITMGFYRGVNESFILPEK